MAHQYEVRHGSKRFTSNVAPDGSNVDAILGKGSKRRPAVVDVTANWCATFGHKDKHGFCLNCGRVTP